MIARERRRLRSAFSAALLAVAAPSLVQACSDQAHPGTPGNGGDASTGLDGRAPPTPEAGPPAPPVEGGADVVEEEAATGDAPFDAAACVPNLFRDDASPPDAGPDADLCDLLMPCGLPAGLAIAGCTVEVNAPDGAAVPDSAIGCWVPENAGCSGGVFEPAEGGELELQCFCDLFVPGGRRPPGLRRVTRFRARDALGAHLARMAHDEAASVDAFVLLRADLVRLGAPGELSREAARAERDEIRHAREMARLASRRAAEPRRPRRKKSRERDLEAVARENAVEGCVRETYGALVAHWQSNHAADQTLRRSFQRIAVDETRHAALAWAVARWANGRLDGHARARIARAHRAAIRTLARELGAAPDDLVVKAAGVPRPAEARALLKVLFEA